MNIIGWQVHSGWKDPWSSLVQLSAAGRVSSDITPSCSGCSSLQASNPWRTDHQPGQPIYLPGCPQDKNVSYIQLETLLFQFLLTPIFLYLSRESPFFYWSFRKTPMVGVIYFFVSNIPNYSDNKKNTDVLEDLHFFLPSALSHKEFFLLYSHSVPILMNILHTLLSWASNNFKVHLHMNPQTLE